MFCSVPKAQGNTAGNCCFHAIGTISNFIFRNQKGECDLITKQADALSEIYGVLSIKRILRKPNNPKPIKLQLHNLFDSVELRLLIMLYMRSGPNFMPVLLSMGFCTLRP